MPAFIWNVESIINPELAKRCIEHPENYLLKVDFIEFLGQGWDNVAFLVNKKYVFRFPRKQEAEQLLCDENKVLPKLHEMLSLQIPKPIYFGKPNELYPFHFHGYQILIGTPAYQADLSDDELRMCLQNVAQFLKQLHSIKAVRAQAMGAQLQMYDRTNVNIVIESLQKRMGIIQEKNIYALDHVFIDTLIAQAQVVIINRDNDCLAHGDLDYRHMLLQDNKLTGIIDWGDVGISHPVVDLGVIHGMFPKSMHANFFTMYGAVEKDIWVYAKFLALHRAITLMLYGFDIKDAKMFAAAVQSYERLKD